MVCASGVLVELDENSANWVLLYIKAILRHHSVSCPVAVLKNLCNDFAVPERLCGTKSPNIWDDVRVFCFGFPFHPDYHRLFYGHVQRSNLRLLCVIFPF